MRLAAGQIRPNVAVLDVNLAGEMVFRDAETPTTRSVPVLFSTAYTSVAISAEYNIKTVAVPRKTYATRVCLQRLEPQ